LLFGADSNVRGCPQTTQGLRSGLATSRSAGPSARRCSPAPAGRLVRCVALASCSRFFLSWRVGC
jgi:hypothetical protein